MSNIKTKLKIAARTDVGKVRDHNEDNFIVCSNLDKKEWLFDNQKILAQDRSGSLLVVADGMGGMNAGEVASKIAIEAIRNYFDEKISSELVISPPFIINVLKGAVQAANKEIFSHEKQYPETEGMGTTIVVAWITGNQLYCTWCGDSRCYIFNPDLMTDNPRVKYFLDEKRQVTGNLAQVSKDHSFVQELIDKGKITIEQAFYHPSNNIITKSLGGDERVMPEIFSCEIQKGDRILLCSDGLCGMLMDEQIVEIIQNQPDVNQCVAALVDAANESGGNDNITAVMAVIVETAPAASGARRSSSKRFLIPLLLAIITVTAYGLLREKKSDHLFVSSPVSFVTATGDTIVVKNTDTLSVARSEAFSLTIIATDSVGLVADGRRQISLKKGDSLFIRQEDR